MPRLLSAFGALALVGAPDDDRLVPTWENGEIDFLGSAGETAVLRSHGILKKDKDDIVAKFRERGLEKQFIIIITERPFPERMYERLPWPHYRRVIAYARHTWLKSAVDALRAKQQLPGKLFVSFSPAAKA